MSKRITLYVHPKTVRYTDFGDLLSTETGIAWSADNDPDLAIGFEAGMTLEKARARLATINQDGLVELLEGEPIARTFDMNPHGLI